MDRIIEEKLALRISAAILLQQGEISIDDIRSLPFLSKDFDAHVVTDSLLQLFNAELTCNRVSSGPFLKWEQTIRLRELGQGSYAH